VRQFTGEKDCEGNEIYYGDLLLFKKCLTQVEVSFKLGSFGHIKDFNFISLNETNLGRCKVIGARFSYYSQGRS
jgi:hypothetical protein